MKEFNIKLTDLCLHKKNFLSQQECQFLIDFYENQNNDKKFKEVSTDANDNIVKNSTFTAGKIEPASKEYYFIKKKIREAFLEYAKYIEDLGIYNSLILNYVQFGHSWRILKYEKGEKIHPHLDHSFYNYFSTTFNLNNDYEGGEFTFFNGKFTPDLGVGDLMIFPSDLFWLHEVKPVTKGARYSFNTFMMAIPDYLSNQIKEQLATAMPKYLNSKSEDSVYGPVFPERFLKGPKISNY